MQRIRLGQLEAPRLQRFYKKFARAADVGGGGQHDRLAHYRVVNHARTHPTMRSGRESGVHRPVSARRRRSPPRRTPRRVRSSGTAPCRCAPDARDRGPAGRRAALDLGQATLADVEADDVCAVVGEAQGSRQADVAQPHHRNSSSLERIASPCSGNLRYDFGYLLGCRRGFVVINRIDERWLTRPNALSHCEHALLLCAVAVRSATDSRHAVGLFTAALDGLMVDRHAK